MLRRFLFTIGMVVVLLTNSSAGLAKKPSPEQPQKPDLPEHIPGELLIRFNPGVNSAQKMNEHGLEHKKEIKPIGVHLVKLPPGLSVEEALDRFSQRPGIEFVEPNYILNAQALVEVVIDEHDQWALDKIAAPSAWSIFGTEPNRPLLAIVDTGITFDHPDLVNNLWENPGETGLDAQEADKRFNGIDDDGNGHIDDWQGWDFVNTDNEPLDDQMHGTAVSSVAAAEENGIGIAGVCPWCQLVGVKVLDPSGAGNLAVVADGILYAAQIGAKVINLSLGATSTAETLGLAVADAWNAGAVVVAGAGNNGLKTLFYPAAYPEAMAVASTGAEDYHSCFSNYSPDFISVSAPGEGVIVADITNYDPEDPEYGFYNGTSLSAPHVTGLAGLLFSQDPGRTNQEVRSIIENSAVDLGPLGFDDAFGYGRIDALRAVTQEYTPVIPADGIFSSDDTATGYSFARKLVRDDTGTLHMIWHTKQEGPTYRIRYANSTDNGATWNLMPDAYSNPNETYHPALATDGEYLFAAIPSKSGPEASAFYQILFTRKQLPDGDWENAVPIMGGAVYHTVRPSMYFDPTGNGRLHVIASSLDHLLEGTSDLYYIASEDQGATWINFNTINPSGSDSKTRYATLHANGDNIYVVARTVTSLLGIITYYYMYTMESTDGGTTWSDGNLISSFLAFTSGEYGISLAGVGDRVYMGYNVGPNLYFRRNEGAGWSDYLELETGGGGDPLDPEVYKWPTITQAEDGEAWLMFEEHKQLYLHLYDGSSWTDKKPLGSGTYANFELGTGGDRINWLQTGCNSSPFNVIFTSRSVEPPVADHQDVTTDVNTPAAITLTGSDLDDDELTFEIDSGPVHGVLSGTTPDLTYTPDPDFDGSDSFTFFVNDGFKDSLPGTVSITVNPVDEFPVAEFSASPTSGAAPLTVSYSDLSTGNITSWLWNFGDGGSSTLQNPDYEYTTHGIYTVSLTVFGPAGDAIETKADYIIVTDLIFADGFETNDFSAWSAVSDGGGDLSVTTGDAAVIGTYGLQAVIDDTTPMYLRDNTPEDETRYRARFYFDPNGITMAEGNQFYMFAGRSGGASTFNLYLRYYDGQYLVKAGAVDDSSIHRYTSWYPLTDERHYLEIDWAAATADGANDGYLSLYIDGVLRQTRTAIDNDTRRVDQAVLGPWQGIDSGTTGTLYFDAFESHREDYTGMAGVVADFTATPLNGAAPLEVTFSDASLFAEPITSWSWDFGDTIGTSTDQNPVYTYTSEGIYTVTLTVTSANDTDTLTRAAYITAGDIIFADGFEDGTLDAWSSTVGPDLTVSPSAALIGSQGMQVDITSTASRYLVDETPDSDTRYRARFYFDPNGITMAEGDQLYMFAGRSGGVSSFNLYLRYYDGQYLVKAGAVDDSSIHRNTSWYPLTDEQHYIEIEWAAATFIGEDDGYLSLYIDGVLKQTRTDIDNDTRRVDQAVLGPWQGIDSGTTGTLYFDAFESHREDYIGMAGVKADFTAAPRNGAAPLEVTFSDASLFAEPITAWSWDFGDGIGTSTDQNPDYIYTSEGIYTVTLTVTSANDTDTLTRTAYINVGDTIFADGFETNDFSRWSYVSDGGGDLSVAAGDAALVGTYGLQALIDEPSPIYVRDDTPEDETLYRARFYLDPNGLTMAEGDQFYMFAGRSGGASSFNVYLRYFNGQYRVKAGVVDDSSSHKNTSWYTLTDEQHYIEVDWAAASAPGANDGYLTLYIDGVLMRTRSNIDNDTRRVDQALLGPWQGIDSSTSGIIYFDDFESRMENYIGP